MSKTAISVIHGPNLNLLGTREPEHYGKMSLKNINDSLAKRAKELNMDIEFFQSNSESDIVNKIQSLSTNFTIINPAAFTHSSVAIRDSLVAKISNLLKYTSQMYLQERILEKIHFFLM